MKFSAGLMVALAAMSLVLVAMASPVPKADASIVRRTSNDEDEPPFNPQSESQTTDIEPQASEDLANSHLSSISGYY